MANRCFIFGNSPGLLEEELTKLQNEHIIICNRGYKIKQCVDFKFHNINTHVLADAKHARQFIDEIAEHTRDMTNYVCSVVDPIHRDRLHDPVVMFPRIREEVFNQWPGHLSQGWGRTRNVICDAIMIAHFMGYDHIYLLGVDLDYGDGNNHFYDCSEFEVRNRKNVPNSLSYILSAMQIMSTELQRRGKTLVNLSRGFRHGQTMQCGTLEDIDEKK